MPHDSDTELDRFTADLLVALYTVPQATALEPDGQALQRLVSAVAPDGDTDGKYMAAARRLGAARRGQLPLVYYLDQDMQRIRGNRTMIYYIAPVDHAARPLYEAVMAAREAAELQKVSAATTAAGTTASTSTARRSSAVGRQRALVTLPPVHVLAKQIWEAYRALLIRREELLGDAQEGAESPAIRLSLRRAVAKVRYDGEPLDATTVIYYLRLLGLVSNADQPAGQWIIVPGGDVDENTLRELIDAGQVPYTYASASSGTSSTGTAKSGSAARIQKLEAAVATLTRERDAAITKADAATSRAASATKQAATLRRQIRAARSRVTKLGILLDV